MKPKIFLFTKRYPYDKGEEFLEAEIFLLSKFFNIIIVPQIIFGKRRKIPDNVKIDKFFSNYKKSNRFLFGITKIRKIMKEYLVTRNPYFYKSFSYFEMEKSFKEWFKQYKDLKGPIVFYSYWFLQEAYAAASLKKYLGHKAITVISRAHGGDLYEFRYKYNYLPLRKEILKNIDRVFCISEDGKNYLSNKYPKYKYKIEISRLGVARQNKVNTGSSDNVFRIVSCSYMVPTKRINLIIDALYVLSKNFTKKIIWIHIGSGPLEKKIKNYAEKLNKTNIVYSFVGYLSNKEVQEYYRKYPIDLFLNVSESEGLPVSIMEALSFGIPVIATDVGGTRELVDEYVGKLIPANVSPENLSEYLYKFINLPNNIIKQKRINALKRWNGRVNAAKNYKDFAERILKLLQYHS